MGVFAEVATANTVTGKLELPPAPDRPAVTSKGFLDRVENSLAPVKGANVTSQIVVVLEQEGGKVETPAAVNWDLAGESFSKPVIGAPVGAEVVIKNTSKTARNLTATEDPKLIPAGPINPTGPKSFRPTEPKIYTIGDKDTPHLKGVLVVVNTKHVANVDAAGKFDFGDVPEGEYKLRVFYKSGWIDKPDDTVKVGSKGKTEVSVKVPAGFPLKK
ncbi:MAG: hypothetical protein M4D80_39665 [Myxococcota bacterium]|nr:hypothetical protein [Myxococcota bacterium]